MKHLLFALFFIPLSVHAQEVPYVTLSHKSGSLDRVVVSIDAQNKTLNAFETTITFDPSVMTLVSVSENKDLGMAWIERPNATSDGRIRLYGVIPGGFQDTFDPLTQKSAPTPVADLFFMPKKDADTIIKSSDAAVYLHSEVGTKIPSLDASVSAAVYAQGGVSTDDTEPPVISALQVIETTQAPGVSVFVDTFDEASGIKEIEMQQGSEWVVVGNPAVVERSFFRKNISFRVTDGVGNQAIATAAIPGISPFVILLFFGIIGVLSICIWLRKKYHFLS